MYDKMIKIYLSHFYSDLDAIAMYVMKTLQAVTINLIVIIDFCILRKAFKNEKINKRHNKF